MGRFVKSKLTVDRSALLRLEGLPKDLRDKVFPRVAVKVLQPIKASIISKLPDGQSGERTRLKQSKKTRLRFPHNIQLKKNVGRKTIRDATGALLIIGVNSKAAHVNFDHGDKALTIGRTHKLWWVDGEHEVYHTPQERKQTQDIPELVANEFRGEVGRIFEEEVKAELQRLAKK